MPELPEVETIRRGLARHAAGRHVDSIVVRERRLRWPIPHELETALPGRRLNGIARRAKYLLMTTDAGTLIVHLGMSGVLRLLPAETPAAPHDHVDIGLDNGMIMRLTDPRRFGALLWCVSDPQHHPLLARLGPEPLEQPALGDHLHRISRGRRQPVKALLMDARVVAGLGNIYANEALHVAGIHPARQAGRISRARYRRLAGAISEVLQDAIAAGGTTLRDFLASDGKPGYFSQQLRVYGRPGAPCRHCAAPITLRVLAQRATYYCRRCQR
jgi:formamidopyrimidine-DNA glycosylase